jgi:hypothetical protein
MVRCGGPDGVVVDRTELLLNQYVDGTGPNRQRIALLDAELTAFSFLTDGEEVTRAQGDHIFHALEDAVPTGRWFWRAGLDVAARVLTLERPARARLEEWVASGGDLVPPRAAQ